MMWRSRARVWVSPVVKVERVGINMLITEDFE